MDIKSLILDNGLFEYQLKWQELLWAAVQGLGAFIVAGSVAPDNYTGWQAWAIGAGIAALRPVIAIVLGRRPASPDPAPAPTPSALGKK